MAKMIRTLYENVKFVQGVAPGAATTVSADYINLKLYKHLTILINLSISSGTDTGAVTLSQATDVSGTNAKSLAFTKMYANTDTSASDTLVATTVTSSTFNAGGAAKNMQYLIEIDTETLDVDNGFDCVKINIADITNGTVCVDYFGVNPRYFDQTTKPSAIV